MDANETLHKSLPPVVVMLAAAGFTDAHEVGRGGFGVVYRCTQEGLDRVVAVKVLTATMADDRARFLREQQAMGRLTGHPNIVAVLQAGELDGGVPFLAMPFCGEGCVQDRIARLGALPLDEVLRLGVKMAGALASAHRLGIVHRDVKPANILLTDYGEPALSDFGIARVGGGFQTEAGLFAGSPAFSAPEVIGGGEPTAASDVYGLGASLFAALTGHPAFERRSSEKVVAQLLRIATEPVPDLCGYGVAYDVSAVINAAMSRDPDRRPSPLELGRQLQELQASHGFPIDEMSLHGTDGSPRRVGGLAATPGPATGRSTPGNLPAALTGVVGRGADLARLRELLATSRLVSLTGIGGIGKTTLAVHAARELACDFTDGVWLVELAELRDASLLTEVMAAALGVRDQSGRPVAEAVVGYLAPRRVLLVLDNCEHLIEDVAKLGGALLRECPRLHILATSREVLDIEGEAVMALAPLPCPARGDDPTVRTLAGYEAVALFIERARAVRTGFALTDTNAPAVAQICAALDGLPLALELAAARVRALSVERIAEGLADRFALLTHGRRGAPTRQHTLAGCVDWSYELCTPAERHLWAQLSVFAGSFDLPAAQHLCGDELRATECLEVLCSLVDKSILVRTEYDDRFRLLDTLREYGQAHLSDTELHRRRQRHAAWYQQLSAQASAQWFGPGQPQWLRRIALEMPNIREALRFSLGDDPAAALQMTSNVYLFWQIRGMYSEVRQGLDMALNASTSQPTRERIRGIHYAIMAAAQQGDLPAARRRIAEGRTLLESIEDPNLHARIAHAEAYVAVFGGEVEHARECFERAVDLAGSDDYLIRAMSMNQMGMMLAFLGHHDDAMRWQEKGLALTESRGDPYLRACAQNNLATSLWRRGETQRAQQLLRESVHTCSVLNEFWVCAHSLEELAWIACSHHDFRRAVVLMAAASTLVEGVGATLNPLPEMMEWHDACESRARKELGAVEFETAWAQGNALSLGEAAAFAVSDGANPAYTFVERAQTS